MKKIVVFDCTYGGELFADQLEQEYPIVEVIRVIDWRNSETIQSNPRLARKLARDALAPYIGKVDLIVIANFLLSITSLKYFKRKFKNQKFIGLNLKEPDTFADRKIIILTTKAVARTISYRNYLFRIKRRTETLILDTWTDMIDDGVFTESNLRASLDCYQISPSGRSTELILANTIFNDIIPLIKDCYGRNLKIHSSFNDTIREACKALGIRGGLSKK